jgi:hypothetical protein
MKTEEDFRAVPKLRWHVDSDGCAIATSNVMARSRDHAYFHGPDKLGIYVERKTPLAFKYAIKAYRRQANVIGEQLGDVDGILVISADRIPKCFFRGNQKPNSSFKPAARCQPQA